MFLPLALNPPETTFWYGVPTTPPSVQQPRLGDIYYYVDVYVFSPGRTPQLALKKIDDTLPIVVSPGGRYVATPSEIFDRGTGARAKITVPPTALFGTDTFWRPDGKRIAYRQTTDGISRFYTANPDVTDVVEIRINGQPTSSGTWSPDSMHLAIVTNQGVYVTLADGSQPVRVADSCSVPTWSPDGNSIACVVVGGQGVRTLLVVGANGTASHTIATLDTQNGVQIIWSPDSTHLAYRADDGLRIINVNGSTPQASRRTDIALFAWSPDSRKIAYATNEYGYLGNALYLINADGTGERQLVQPDAKLSLPFLWSPDSAHVLYATTTTQHAYSIAIATGTQQLVTATPVTNLFGFADGGQTVYALNRSKDDMTFLAIRGTEAQPLLTSVPNFNVGAWLAP